MDRECSRCRGEGAEVPTHGAEAAFDDFLGSLHSAFRSGDPQTALWRFYCPVVGCSSTNDLLTVYRERPDGPLLFRWDGLPNPSDSVSVARGIRQLFARGLQIERKS